MTKIGTGFSHAALGTDVPAIRDYVQAVEGAGFDYMIAIDHVTGSPKERFDPPPFDFRPANSGMTYTHEALWHEPLTLFAYLSAITTTLEFVPSVLLLSQRQTVLAAKQMAELDILSGGRFRLAIGIGWNFTEHEALGTNFFDRQKRMEEQMVVLRKLWSEPLVTFDGEWHKLDRVGINPLPSRVLPIWYASSARNVVLRRTAQLADGWMPLLIPPEEPQMAVARLHKHLSEAGKDPATFPIDARIYPGRVDANGDPVDWMAAAKLWHAQGASHICVNAVAPGKTPMQNLEEATRVRKIIEEEFGP